MMYQYLTLGDNTEVTHSHLINRDGVDTVEVHFERPVSDGFQSARCRLPDYTWLFNDGFAPADISFFEELLRYNAHLFFRFAGQGGTYCA